MSHRGRVLAVAAGVAVWLSLPVLFVAARDTTEGTPTSAVVAHRASSVTCPPLNSFTLTLDGGTVWCGRVTDGNYTCTPTP